MSVHADSRLGRRLGLGGAIALGIGAMVGTGLFAVWTPAAEFAGSFLVIAVLGAAAIAALNAISTARLARVLPRAGGVYAYGSHFLARPWGVTAGVVFLLGKAASASAAALTIGTYVMPEEPRVIAILALLVALLIDARGIVRTARVTAIMIGVVLVVIATVVLTFWSSEPVQSSSVSLPTPTLLGFLGAVGVIFVAFAGYARITVLGEEVRDPATTIPRAMTVTFVSVAALYVVVATAIATFVGSGGELSSAPIENLARVGGVPSVVVVVAAVLAAGGVLLALITGMGRTLYAMADAGDGPRLLARVDSSRGVPVRAEVAATVLAGLGVAAGGIALSLALSATFILIYYSIAHLASWRLGGAWVLGRLIPVFGLAGCLVIAAASALLAFAST